MSRNHPPTISTQHEADKLDVSYPYLDFGGSVLGTEMLHFVSALAPPPPYSRNDTLRHSKPDLHATEITLEITQT
ncbi:hypothetical protein ONZ45_g17489 [Pleurotus djamor]|nr:hypothetical protein ONZ45_g17489 [Pleurotus djamor]